MRRARFAVPAGLACAATAAATTAAPAPAASDHGHTRGFQNEDAPEFERDLRRGRIAPTAAQRDAAGRLATRVRFNRFGTPASLIRHGAGPRPPRSPPGGSEPA